LTAVKPREMALLYWRAKELTNMTAANRKIPATLVPGDGIGPEIVAAVVEILKAAGAPFA
jgi:isocitrate dehydrogenase